MTADAVDDEWITTRDAAAFLGHSIEQARELLEQFQCGKKKERNKARWRRADVVALKQLRSERRGHRRVEKTERPCLCCSRPFPSEGIHNRLCDLCRRDAGALADHSVAWGRK